MLVIFPHTLTPETQHTNKHENIRQLCFTFTKVGQRLQDAPPESGHRVLDTGAQAEHALQVGLFQQQLPVSTELVSSAQQGCNTVNKLWHQAGVCVVRLAVVIRHHLEHKERRKTNR